MSWRSYDISYMYIRAYYIQILRGNNYFVIVRYFKMLRTNTAAQIIVGKVIMVLKNVQIKMIVKNSFSVSRNKYCLVMIKTKNQPVCIVRKLLLLLCVHFKE